MWGGGGGKGLDAVKEEEEMLRAQLTWSFLGGYFALHKTNCHFLQVDQFLNSIILIQPPLLSSLI